MKHRIFATLCCGLLMSAPALAQNQAVTGKVVDETGEPVIGATVTLAGQKGTGTITDLDGNYTL